MQKCGSYSYKTLEQAFVPPHFRRWMHRFMRKWHENPGNKCPADGSAECSGPSTSENAQQDKSTLDDDYLKNIGEGVAAFLDPFGKHTKIYYHSYISTVGLCFSLFSRMQYTRSEVDSLHYFLLLLCIHVFF